MRDYFPDEGLTADDAFAADEAFTLEDILQEFGSEADIQPPEPKQTEMTDEAAGSDVNPPQDPAVEPEEAAQPPAKPRRRKSARRREAPTPAASEEFYEDEFAALEGEEEDYGFSLKPPKKERRKKRTRTAQRPRAPKKARSLESIVQDVEKQEKKLDLRLRICLVVSVVNSLLAVYHGLELHWIRGFENVASMGIISLLLLLCAIGAAYDVILKGVRQLAGSRYRAEALLPILCVAGIAEAIQAVSAERLPFCAMISLTVLCALWARQRQAQAMRTAALLVKNAASLDGVRRIDKAWQEDAAAARGEADVDRIGVMLDADGPQAAVMRIYVPLALVVSLLLGVLSAILGHINFLWIWAALLLVAAPVSCFLCYALPNAMLAESLAKKKAALCGWQGAQILSRSEALFLRNADLFPAGCLKLSGVKVFGSYLSSQIMSYAAAILHTVGCDAAELLQMPGGVLPSVSNLRAFDEGGYSAELGTDTVLIGTLSFLNRMGVHRESGARVRQALYVAINGELAGLIALRYEASQGVQRALQSLSSSSAPTPVLSCTDVLITPAMLRTKFRMPLPRLVCPPLRERMRCAEITADENDLQGAVVAKAGLEPISAVCLGAKAFITAVHTALVLSVLAGAVGMIVLFLMATSDSMGFVTCAGLIGFALVWALGFLITALSVLKK